jgi:hypothetical protein
MSACFYDHVRGRTDEVPPGYELRGLRVYRYLVRLGAAQMVESAFPALRQQLGEPAWDALIQDFVRHSAWTSPFYGDLDREFEAHLASVLQRDAA